MSLSLIRGAVSVSFLRVGLSLLLLLGTLSAERCGIGTPEHYTKWIDAWGFLRFPTLEDTSSSIGSTDPQHSDQSCYDDAFDSPVVNYGCHHCPGSDNISCYGSNFTQYPQFFNIMSVPHMKSLHVHFLNIDRIPPNTFQGLNCSDLKIEDGEVEHLSADTFKGVFYLRTLTINNNVITDLESASEIFAGLNNLVALRLENNHIRFHGTNDTVLLNQKTPLLPKLQLLSLAGNPLSYLYKSDFYWLKSTNISYLNLRHCMMWGVDAGFLAPLQSKLLHFDLGGTTFLRRDMVEDNLYRLLDGLHNPLMEPQLVGLGLAKVGLMRIPFRALESVAGSLRYLSLNGNRIGRVGELIGQPTAHAYTFPLMPCLEELDMRHCGLSTIHDGAFTTLPSLERLLLSHNQIYSIGPGGGLAGLSNLLYLDISHNSYRALQSGVSWQLPLFSHTPNLAAIDLSYTYVDRLSAHSFRGPGSNLKNLSLCYSSPRQIEAGIFSELTSLEVLDVSGNSVFGEYFSSDLFVGLNALKKLYMRNCFVDFTEDIQRNLTTTVIDPLQHFSSLQYLDLGSNNVRYLTNLTFAHTYSLRELDLSDNRVVPWSVPVFQGLTKFKRINLQGNDINRITNEMLSEFKQLDSVRVSQNPYLCDCYVKKFTEFVIQNGTATNYTEKRRGMTDDEDGHNSDHLMLHRTHKVRVEGWDVEDEYRCFDANLTEYVEFKYYSLDVCVLPNVDGHDTTQEAVHTIKEREYNLVVIYITCAIVLFVVISATLGAVYHKRQYIKRFAHIVKDAAILSFMDSKETCVIKNPYVYDVFVSYSDSDREWVLNCLLQNLESRSDIKVCLHERDFQVGLSILENIITSMDQSRCILLVISSSFLKSHWCQFELHLSQHRLLETRREELILVLLEDIPKYKRSKMLNYLMRTKTYILWPKSKHNFDGQKLFWRRLHKAVVQSPTTAERGLVSIA